MKFAALGVIALVAIGTVAAFAWAGDNNGQIEKQLAAVRQVTAKYHDVAAARADGYVQFSPCVVGGPLGTMGIHYARPGLIQTPTVDPLQPELLLYVPSPDGGLRLVGVEYMKIDADQNLQTDDDRPTLFGMPFDGPMEGHDPMMPRHYDLHVWIWHHNPSGMFAMFNPSVSCG